VPHWSGRNLSAALRRGLTFWRRSIQARLVVSTVLLGLVVISGMGWFLLSQTKQGLVDARVRSAVAESASETAEAEKRLASVPGTDDDAAQQIALLVEPIVEHGTSRGFGVVLVGPLTEGPDASEGGTRTSPGLDTNGVPASLRDHFRDSDTTAWTFTRVQQRVNGTEVDAAGVAVGHLVHLPADRGRYALYYLFPMDQEEETLALVTRALLTAGALLLVLVAGLTWLVTRQVVTPIRLARRVAERLAAGQLEERLRVRGEDDIARLAQSFNQMAANLQRQIRQLEELSRVQRRFTSDVSHELRTPLTTVRMAGDVLHDARGGFDPNTARAAELLQTELDRFEGLLGDLLEISRFDAGAAVLDVDDVNLVDLAHRIVDMTRPLAEQRGTEVRVEAANSPVLAEADHRRVERILRNLVTNAIDHAESSGVVVYVAGNDHAASVAVRDHGIGLAAGESALVFNRFWRADPARARTSGGTGLGLAISLEDTHLHGGWLQAWGQPGKGAQFRLTLPRRAGGMLRQSPLPLVPTDIAVDPVVKEPS
jgi:two-component system sensor histidine kinase MtrB